MLKDYLFYRNSRQYIIFVAISMSFIRVIQAVRLTVTIPLKRDTHTVIALKYVFEFSVDVAVVYIERGEEMSKTKFRNGY